MTSCVTLIYGYGKQENEVRRKYAPESHKLVVTDTAQAL